MDCEPRRGRGQEVAAWDVAFFEASVDTAEWNRQVADLLQLPHPILSDPGRQVAKAYGVLPGNRHRALRWTFYIGLDGRILFIDRSVTPDGHGEEVPARLKALGIATPKSAASAASRPGR